MYISILLKFVKVVLGIFLLASASHDTDLVWWTPDRSRVALLTPVWVRSGHCFWTTGGINKKEIWICNSWLVISLEGATPSARHIYPWVAPHTLFSCLLVVTVTHQGTQAVGGLARDSSHWAWPSRVLYWNLPTLGNKAFKETGSFLSLLTHHGHHHLFDVPACARYRGVSPTHDNIDTSPQGSGHEPGYNNNSMWSVSAPSPVVSGQDQLKLFSANGKC
jgi:hypothetical protein